MVKFDSRFTRRVLLITIGWILVLVFMQLNVPTQNHDPSGESPMVSRSLKTSPQMPAQTADLSSLATTHRCVGSSKKPQFWKQATCYFRHICFDPTRANWIYIDHAETSHLNVSEMEVSLSPLSAFWKSHGSPAIAWKPDIIQKNVPENAIFLDNLHILYSSYNAEDFGHFLFDELFPLYRAAEIFGVESADMQPLRFSPNPAKKWTCEDMVDKQYSEDWIQNCKRNYATIPRIFTKSGRIKFMSEFDTETRPICFSKLVAGIGMLSDHCEDKTAHGKYLTYDPCNVGIGSVVWNYRNFLIKNIDDTLDPRKRLNSMQILLALGDHWAVESFQEIFEGSDVTLEVLAAWLPMDWNYIVPILTRSNILVTDCSGYALMGLFLPRGATLIMLCSQDEYSNSNILDHFSHVEVIYFTDPEGLTFDVNGLLQVVAVAMENFASFHFDFNAVPFKLPQVLEEIKQLPPESVRLKEMEYTNQTIFVSVASFRDDDCHKTLISAYEKASRPDLIYFGVFEQHAASDIACDDFSFVCGLGSSHPVCTRRNQIHIDRVDALEAKGPTWARHFAELGLTDQEYFLQIDSHTLFYSNWDGMLLGMFKSLHNDYAVISTYPEAIKDMNPEEPQNNKVCVICSTKFLGGANGMIRHDAARCTQMPGKNRGRPLLTPFWGAGLSFSKSHRAHNVPYDEHTPMLFTGEEFIMSARMWTWGYDFYAPNLDVLYHQYAQHGSKRPNYLAVSGVDDKYQLRNRGAERIKCQLGMQCNRDLALLNETEKYSLGTRRTIEQYEQFCGVDLKARTTKDICNSVYRGELRLVKWS